MAIAMPLAEKAPPDTPTTPTAAKARVSGHEEEEGDAELLEEGDVLALVGDVQSAGADEDAADDEQNGLGHQTFGDGPGDERRDE